MDDGKANALSLAMSEGINAALDQAATDAKVVIIRGRPGVLCGGFDLKLIRGDDVAARDAMRAAGMTFCKVATGLDDAHAPARRAYEKAGFDKSVPSITYYRTL